MSADAAVEEVEFFCLITERLIKMCIFFFF